MPLLRQLVAPATTGNTALKDQVADASTAGEEAMDWWTFDVYIELIRHATGWVHKMSAQRNKFHNKEVAANLLSDWLAQQMDDSIFNTFYNGFSAHVVTEISGASNTDHPNGFFAGDAIDEDSVDESDVFDSAVIERMAVWAEENDINPIKLSGGENGFVAIVHPRQMHTLRADQRWIDAQQHGGLRGMENLIFSGAEGMWNGIYVHSSNKVAVPPATVNDNTNKRRAILLGAHSVARAVGQRPQIIKRDDTDYGRINNYAMDTIFGDSRADWTSDDGNSTVSNQSSSIWTTYAADVNA
jgi:N4-gp56 family major capsid protein